ncbi:hypothetical protein G6F40_015352 [Rhizopus arrhizus]|nr:hypothetical protein G6F40_015352 [Rhizopus arrhizus]
MAAAVPNCRAYDPAYAFEVAVLGEDGMRRMLDEQRDEFFYLTVTNENLAQPDMPADAGVRGPRWRLAPARTAAAAQNTGLRQAFDNTARRFFQASYHPNAARRALLRPPCIHPSWPWRSAYSCSASSPARSAASCCFSSRASRSTPR